MFVSSYKIQLFLIFLVCFTLGFKLLPSSTMFLFHDQTQYARVIGFVEALKHAQIPPVYARDFNFGIGYPLFLFYAPLAYWITGAIYILGVGVVNAVRLSFLCSLCVAAIGMYSWLNRRYGKLGSFMGALLFVASPWFASEMFVRGNLATTWFLAFAPWSLWAITRTHEHRFLKAVLISLTFVAHNALSLLWMPILFFYAIVAHRKYRLSRLKLVGIAIIASGAFWIPALSQLNKTYATEIAQMTTYSDHFLCAAQIWTTSFWGFGGSAKGCTGDGMSFMIGKVQIIVAILGVVLGTSFLNRRLSLFVDSLIAIWALFLTLYDALPFWQLFVPLHVIQFPWRFLSIALIFVSGLSAIPFEIFWERVKKIGERDRLGVNKLYKKILCGFTKKIEELHILDFNNNAKQFLDISIPPFSYLLGAFVCVGLCAFVIMMSQKYFRGREVPVSDMVQQFASTRYIRYHAAYDAPEYVPKTVNYIFWQSFRGKQPTPQEVDILRRQFNTFEPSPLLSLMGASVMVISFAFLLL